MLILLPLPEYPNSSTKSAGTPMLIMLINELWIHIVMQMLYPLDYINFAHFHVC